MRKVPLVLRGDASPNHCGAAEADTEAWQILIAELAYRCRMIQDSQVTYLGDERICPDGSAPSDSRPRKDHHIATDEAVVLDDNRLAILCTSASLSSLVVCCYCAGIDAHIRSNNDIVADPNLAGVDDGAIATNHNVLTDVDVVAVIAHERSLDDHVIANTSSMSDRRRHCWRDLDALLGMQNLAEQPCPLCGRHSIVRVRGVVKSPTRRAAPFSLQNELLIKGIVRTTLKHLILLSAWTITGELRV